MANPKYDLTYLRAGNAELKDYLLSKELFWPLGLRAAHNESPYPKMTLGNLLFFQARLHGQDLSPAEESEAARLANELNALRSKWQVKWEEKASREFSSRLRQWKNYLEELRKTPEAHRSYYPNEVRLRVLVHLLGESLANIPPADEAVLTMLDEQMRGLFAAGEFVWDAGLAPSFPQNDHWYLYGEPKRG